MAAADDLDQVIERYHQAAEEFSKGNPEPVKNLYSGRDDVAIANPFFPLTRGREQVVERLERSVQNFSDGEVGFQNVVKWVSDELACTVGIPPLERTHLPYATLAASILSSSKSEGLM